MGLKGKVSGEGVASPRVSRSLAGERIKRREAKKSIEKDDKQPRSINHFFSSKDYLATSIMPSSSSSQLAPHQQSYLSLLLSSQILAFNGPYTLKSGRQSPYFFNAGLFNTGAKVAELARCYAEAIVASGLLGSTQEERQNTVLFGPAYKVRNRLLATERRILLRGKVI